MVKEMRRKAVERALRKHDCTVIYDDGKHTKWGCPCGSHIAPVPRHIDVTAGVIRNIIRDLPCLPKGWLQ